MIISLEKLVNVKENRYLFTKGVDLAIDRLGNIKGYPEDSKSWKTVPCVLQMVLDKKINYYATDDTALEGKE